jgi:hypothetical protein
MNDGGPWRPFSEHMRTNRGSRATPWPVYRMTWTDATNGAGRPAYVQITLELLWRLGHGR